jgi:predicted HTH domain antitoxin
MTISIPDEILEDITAEEIKLDIALSLFVRGKVSIGKAARIAEMNRFQFQSILTERKIPVIQYTDLDEELQRLKKTYFTSKSTTTASVFGTA